MCPCCLPLLYFCNEFGIFEWGLFATPCCVLPEVRGLLSALYSSNSDDTTRFTAATMQRGDFKECCKRGGTERGGVEVRMGQGRTVTRYGVRDTKILYTGCTPINMYVSILWENGSEVSSFPHIHLTFEGLMSKFRARKTDFPGHRGCNPFYIYIRGFRDKLLED